MKSFIIALALSLTGATPAFAKAGFSYEKVLPDYLRIHAALTADKMDGITDAAKSIEKAAKGEPQVRDAAAKLAKVTKIEDARQAFKGLSVPVTAWAEKARPAGMSIMYCSMAEAKWVQKGDDILNPYYDASMRVCGEKK